MSSEKSESPAILVENGGALTDEVENGKGDKADNEVPAETLKAVAEMQDEFDKLQLETPNVDLAPADLNSATYPFTYKENNNKEKLVLQYAENFRRQYVHLYRDRKPLYFAPLNECGVEKFVCTSIRPTLLPFRELYNFDGCSEFVADYITFEPLDSHIELPKTMVSPSTVLHRQRGSCFEVSTLLCSILLGAGYDAYVVCGYAAKEITLRDQTREICPLLKKKHEHKQHDKYHHVHTSGYLKSLDFARRSCHCKRVTVNQERPELEKSSRFVNFTMNGESALQHKGSHLKSGR